MQKRTLALCLAALTVCLVLVGCAPNISKLESRRKWTKIAEALDHSDPNVRREACQALGAHCRYLSLETVSGDGSQCADFAEPLIGVLDDPGYKVRFEAAAALGRIADPRSVPHLIDALQDENANPRKAAAWALGLCGSAASDQALRDEISEPLAFALLDENESVREEAAKALERLEWEPDESPAGVVYLAYQGEWAQCAALGELCLEPLLVALKDPETALIAADGLGSIAAGIDDAEARQKILAALLDKADDPKLAIQVALSLGELGGEEVVEPLVAILETTRSGAVASALGEVCPRLDDPGYCTVAVGPLLSALRVGKDPWQTCETLGVVGAGVSDPAVRQRISDALVETILQNCDGYNRLDEDAADALAQAQLGDEAAQPLLELLLTEKQSCRDQVMMSLGTLGPSLSDSGSRQEVEEALLAGLRSGEKSAREDAAEALVAFHEGQLGQLMPLLRQRNTMYIYEALIEQGDPATEEPLIDALWQYDSKAMALDFLNCGNSRLSAAGRAWARKNGYTVVSLPGTGGPSWGSKR